MGIPTEERFGLAGLTTVLTRCGGAGLVRDLEDHVRCLGCQDVYIQELEKRICHTSTSSLRWDMLHASDYDRIYAALVALGLTTLNANTVLKVMEG